LFDAWQATLDQTTGWLWETIMGELIPVLQKHSQSAIVIPVGQLAFLPLHAAWTEDESRPTRRRYALDEMTFTYAPSAHALWQASLAVARPTDRLLAVENPEADHPGRSLAFAEDEVKAVLSGFDKTRIQHLQGKDATREVVKEEMQQAEVLHFATHGNAGWEKAEQAQLRLADGSLTLPDIFALPLHQTRLAVLSACETGVPGLELIDEMIGLPAGMMQAGVPGVIGSLWSVSDMSTAMLMARFYSLWRQESKAEKRPAPQEALRQAQIWLRDSTTQQKKELFEDFVEGQAVGMSADTAEAFYEHIAWKDPKARIFSSPFYWAAFTYTGI
jgi:CHAT domain-containing protein